MMLALPVMVEPVLSQISGAGRGELRPFRTAGWSILMPVTGGSAT